MGSDEVGQVTKPPCLFTLEIVETNKIPYKVSQVLRGAGGQLRFGKCPKASLNIAYWLIYTIHPSPINSLCYGDTMCVINLSDLNSDKHHMLFYVGLVIIGFILSTLVTLDVVNFNVYWSDLINFSSNLIGLSFKLTNRFFQRINSRNLFPLQ